MGSLALAAIAALGTALLVLPRSGRPPEATRRRVGEWARRWLTQAGLPEVDPRRLLMTCAAAAGGAGVLTHLVFGGWIAAAGAAGLVAMAPVGVLRRRRLLARQAAEEHWPTLIEEVRLATGAAGRSVPRALLEAGDRAPDAMQPAFAAARREWRLTTDFPRTLAALKDVLDSPTADVVAETLLVADELGAVDLDRRLAALADDRRQEVFARRDALAKQAGVRFARRFVILVPAGMALAGMSLGTGRAAYATPVGQGAVAIAVTLVGCCWIWSGRMLRLPAPARVFP